MKTKIKESTNSLRLIAGEGFSHPDTVLLKIKDTGSGLICKFPAWDPLMDQDYYVCLDYEQASYLLKLLSHESARIEDDLPAY